MRVIAGECKGRKLRPVPGGNTRPTTDKVKEAIFNMIGQAWTEGRVLDLYCGSGALAIEALSRGMKEAILIDIDRRACETAKINIQRCGYEARTEVHRNEDLRALKILKKRKLTFDLVFLDPPYFQQRIVRVLKILGREQLLTSEGVVVVEHHESVTVPKQVAGLIRNRTNTYSQKTVISIYQQSNILK